MKAGSPPPVALGRRLPDIAELPSSPPRDLSPSPDQDESTVCIVLIEDHDATREILQAVLETSGYEVHAARDGERGLDAIRAHDPNLVITDIAMPGLDGLDVVRTLQEDETFPPIPVVAATAQSSGYDPDDLKDLFSAVLRKPVDPADLIRTVEALVEKAE